MKPQIRAEKPVNLIYIDLGGYYTPSLTYDIIRPNQAYPGPRWLAGGYYHKGLAYSPRLYVLYLNLSYLLVLLAADAKPLLARRLSTASPLTAVALSIGNNLLRLRYIGHSLPEGVLSQRWRSDLK
jgi:hypothetical protein